MTPFTFSGRLVMLLIFSIWLVGCTSMPHTKPDASTFSLQMPRYGHAAVADDSHIYVVGGSNSSGLVANIEIIDPHTQTSQVLEDVLIPRRYHAAVWDGKESIYIFGGIGKHKGPLRPEPTVEVFNTRTHEVTTTTPMPVPRRFNSASRIYHHIYVTGGAAIVPDKAQRRWVLRTTPLVTRFDLSNATWVRLPDMPEAKSTRTLTYANMHCAVGGYNGTQQSAFDCFNPQTGKWQAMPHMPVPASAHSVVLDEDKLYVFGDYNQLDQVLMFDFDENRWSQLQLPYQSSRHNAAVVFDNAIYVIGGNTGRAGPFLDTVQVFPLPR